MMITQSFKQIKKKEGITSALIIILSFCIPAVILYLIFRTMGFYPDGEKSVLIMDMKQQYVSFYASLRDIGKGDNSMFFSWSRSMGGNYLGLFAYYIASPLSFLTLFFSIENLPVALYILTILKIGLCGLTCAVFLQFAFKNEKNRWAIIIFSICYALMSYNLVYSMCLMWLDAVILLPIVLLGIEQIIAGKRGLLYLLSMTALFISNYYLSYMIGIFAVMFLIFRLIGIWEKKKWRTYRKMIFRFAWNTLLAVGMAMPLLLTTVKDLMIGKVVGKNLSIADRAFYQFDFAKLFYKFLGGHYDSITNVDSYPSIFCGILILILAIVFTLQKQTKKREIAGAFIICGLILLSFWIVKLDYAWHGFSVPNWFPFRYAFLFSAFIIYLAYRAYLNLPVRGLLHTVMLSAAFVFVCIEMYQNGVAMINGLNQQFPYVSMKEYQTFIEQNQPLIREIQTQDGGLYRIDKDYEFSKNDSMLLGFNGMAHYSSSYNNQVNQLTAKLGLAQAHFWNSGYGSTLLMDSLFDVKYRLAEKKVSPEYQLFMSADSLNVYLNPYACSIAFAADAGCLGSTYDYEKQTDVFQNQNQLMKELTGMNVDCFNKMEYFTSTIDGQMCLNFTAKSSNPIYLKITKSSNVGGTIYVNDINMGKCFSSETDGAIYLGTFTPGTQVSVRLETTGSSYGEWIYELDMEKFRQAVHSLEAGQLQVSKHQNGVVEGTVTTQKNQVLFTSIPYEDGLEVTVDGKAVDLYTYHDTFLLIPVEEGTHQIHISYVSAGFRSGIIVALFAVLLAVLSYQSKNLQVFIEHRKRKEAIEK